MPQKFEVVRPGFIARADSDDGTSSVADKPSDREILTQIVAANGVVPQAAAKLSISKEDVYEVIMRNPRIMSTMLRARLMVDTFTSLIKVQLALGEALPTMLPGDLGRTYAATIAAFTNLAGQFEEDEKEAQDDDDATAAKEFMLARVESMKRREASNEQEEKIAT